MATQLRTIAWTNGKLSGICVLKSLQEKKIIDATTVEQKNIKL